MFSMFLVGGAVRDKFLYFSVDEFDWLVVNVDSDFMFKHGFKRVGKDFPVFLHPISKEEYALARKEKKVGKGYYGFKCDFSIYVSLSEDLLRRDLTINSLVLNSYGMLVDFFFSIYDINRKKIVHVSFAFLEDPLRVFRICRFFAKYSSIGFSISDYTLSFIKIIVLNGEVFNLTFERIFKEIFSSLKYETCFLFFCLLYSNGILTSLFYDLNLLFCLSKKFNFNVYLDFVWQLKNLFRNVHFFTNNVFLKFSIFFYRLTFNILSYRKINKIFFYNRKNFLFVNSYSDIFNLSKKHKSFLSNIQIFKFFFVNLMFIGNYYVCLLFFKVNAFKDKVRVINYIFINDIDSCNHDKIYNFYYKYFFLDLLDNINCAKLLAFDIFYLNSTNYFYNAKLIYFFNKSRYFYNRFNFFI